MRSEKKRPREVSIREDLLRATVQPTFHSREMKCADELVETKMHA